MMFLIFLWAFAECKEIQEELFLNQLRDTAVFFKDEAPSNTVSAHMKLIHDNLLQKIDETELNSIENTAECTIMFNLGVHYVVEYIYFKRMDKKYAKKYKYEVTFETPNNFIQKLKNAADQFKEHSAAWRVNNHAHEFNFLKKLVRQKTFMEALQLQEQCKFSVREKIHVFLKKLNENIELVPFPLIQNEKLWEKLMAPLVRLWKLTISKKSQREKQSFCQWFMSMFSCGCTRPNREFKPQESEPQVFESSESETKEFESNEPEPQEPETKESNQIDKHERFFKKCQIKKRTSTPYCQKRILNDDSDYDSDTESQKNSKLSDSQEMKRKLNIEYSQNNFFIDGDYI